MGMNDFSAFRSLTHWVSPHRSPVSLPLPLFHFPATNISAFHSRLLGPVGAGGSPRLALSRARLRSQADSPVYFARWYHTIYTIRLRERRTPQGMERVAPRALLTRLPENARGATRSTTHALRSRNVTVQIVSPFRVKKISGNKVATLFISAGKCRSVVE